MDAEADGRAHLRDTPPDLRGPHPVSLPLAHAGHYIDGVIFAIPVLVLVMLLVGDSLRERRRRGQRD